MKKKGKIAMKRKHKKETKSLQSALIRVVYIFVLSATFLTFNSCSLFESSVYLEFELFWEDQRINEFPEREFTTESGEVIIIDDLK